MQDARRYVEDYSHTHNDSIPTLYFTAGVHPHFIHRCPVPLQRAVKELRELADHPRCAAVGDTGLDFFRQHFRPDRQETWFEEHVSRGWGRLGEEQLLWL